METHIITIKRYFEILEQGSAEELEQVLATDFIQIEWPNLLTIKRTTRNLQQAMESVEAGRRLLVWQSYEPLFQFSEEENCFLKAHWKAEVALTSGPFQKGQVLEGNFAIWLKFREDRIYYQENFDCFEHTFRAANAG